MINLCFIRILKVNQRVSLFRKENLKELFPRVLNHIFDYTLNLKTGLFRFNAVSLMRACKAKFLFFRTLSEMMDTYRSSNIAQEEESVLSSSTDLFLFYRQTLVQCSKLSTNKPFLDLCRLFGKWLRVYSDAILSKLPK